MNKIPEEKTSARDCPFCKAKGKIYRGRMKKQQNGSYHCNGCGNTLSKEKLEETNEE